MSGYNLEMGPLLKAMKSELLSNIPYLNDVRIVNGPFWANPDNTYTIYLRPGGSPETVDAEDGDTGIVKHAEHVVVVDLAMLIVNPFDEDSVVGRTSEMVGITAFVGDVCELLENNTLGLSGSLIETGVPPVIQFPDNAYGAMEADTDIWLQTARGIYRARTRPFYRTGTFA